MIARFSDGGATSRSDSRDRYQRFLSASIRNDVARYHESTKHSVESLRPVRHTLDWANMPDPFRHYEGVPVVDLPSDPPAPETPALDVLQGGSGGTVANDDPAFLSQLLFYAAAISASKCVPSTGSKYALRVNPSSGNLHPTEFHFSTRGVKHWPDGLYHYRASSHTAEQRALGNFATRLTGMDAPIVFVLTSIGGAKRGNTATGHTDTVCTTWDMLGKRWCLPRGPWDATSSPPAISRMTKLSNSLA